MALEVVAKSLSAHPDVRVDIVDPSELDLPLPGREATSNSVSEIQEVIGGATAVILATPEYHGSFSSVMKLVIENLGFPSVLAGKPVALLGVAGGSIGAIKSLEQLRGVCSHVGAIVLPGPVSVAHVRSAFNEKGECIDPDVEGRIQGLGENLLGYIQQNVCPRMTLEAMVRAE
jgi:FMN reductase